jgi:hypothetical protein
MKAYSPFPRQIHELDVADLAFLRQAAEGWYIEYKQQEVTASDTAKSLSAFANTYGGWLFFGVAEESKSNPVAGLFPGVPATDVDAILQRLRKSASDHVNPTPHFETRVLYGPYDAIGLPDGRAVICIWLPQSSAAPHVHKSGRIYRRVADSSEPRPENDRFTLDQLWKRKDLVKTFHEKWDERDPEFSEAERKLPYLRVMLIADPWLQRDLWLDADEEAIRATLNDPCASTSIPFDAFYTSAEGFVARQLTNNDPQNLTLTWRFRRDLRSDVIIPLPIVQCDRPSGLVEGMRGYKHVTRLISLLERYRPGAIRVVDLNFLFGVLFAVAETQERICKLANYRDGYSFRLKLLNAWRTIPFVDVPQVFDQFEKRGVPMCLDSKVSLPSAVGPDSFVSFTSNADVNDIASVGGQFMFHAACMLYGIPGWVDHDEVQGGPTYFDSLVEAGGRAMARQAKLRPL